jgi:hypothetical protein
MNNATAPNSVFVRWVRFSLGIVCSLWLTAAASATAWVLLNGDHITGELINETGTAIVVQHPTLGRIEIPCSALAPSLGAKTGSVHPTAPVGVKWKR